MTTEDIEYAVRRSAASYAERVDALYADKQQTDPSRTKKLKDWYGTASWPLTFPDGVSGWLNCSRSKGVEIRKGMEAEKLTWTKAEKIMHELIDSGRF